MIISVIYDYTKMLKPNLRKMDVSGTLEEDGWSPGGPLWSRPQVYPGGVADGVSHAIGSILLRAIIHPHRLWLLSWTALNSKKPWTILPLPNLSLLLAAALNDEALKAGTTRLSTRNIVFTEHTFLNDIHFNGGQYNLTFVMHFLNMPTPKHNYVLPWKENIYLEW